MEHLPRLLSGGADGCLPIRSCDHEVVGSPNADRGACRSGADAFRRAALAYSRRLGTARAEHPSALDSRHAFHCSGSAVLPALGVHTRSATMVCEFRSQIFDRSLLPVRRQQRRQPRWAAGLSIVVGANTETKCPESSLELWLWAFRRNDRDLRSARMAATFCCSLCRNNARGERRCHRHTCVVAPENALDCACLCAL